MEIAGHRQTWEVDNEEELVQVLARRDPRGGAEFWLSQTHSSSPCLAIRISGTLGDFFPGGEHPGYRCLGGEGLTADGSTTLVYEGCDPGGGVEVSNHFIVPLGRMLLVAIAFYHDGRMSPAEEWFEL